jgi:hypothetical protein
METALMSHTAQCACGSAAIEVAGESVAHGVCHCDNCKRRTGSAFGISVYFRKRDIVRIAGELTLYALHNKARNEDQERHFCTKCGTTLYWHSSTYPDFVGIAGGCFAGEALGEPNINSSSSKKLSWVTVPSAWRVME